MFKFLVKLFSSFFFIGYLPLVPGTFGSLAGVALFFLFQPSLSAYLFVTSALLILGFWSSNYAEFIIGKKDPSSVVIDEVCGMLLGLLFVPYDIKLVVLAFLIFRILDTLKPYPVGRIERLKGGIGIMGDDIIAGLYTNVILQIVVRLTSLRAS